jgi:hypothetical protein
MGEHDEHRQDAIRALRDLADFLDAHPDLPVPWVDARPGHGLEGTDEEKRAEVDRIAAILGVQAKMSESGAHYEAERDFGHHVIYRQTAITQAEMAAWREHMAHYAGPSRAGE